VTLAERLRDALHEGRRRAPVLLTGDDTEAPAEALFPAAVLVAVVDHPFADDHPHRAAQDDAQASRADQLPRRPDRPRDDGPSPPRCARPRRRSPFPATRWT
jgi:hypothetical protein